MPAASTSYRSFTSRLSSLTCYGIVFNSDNGEIGGESKPPMACFHPYRIIYKQDNSKGERCKQERELLRTTPQKLDILTTIQLLGLRLADYTSISLLLQHFINSSCCVIKVHFIHALTVCNPCVDCTRSDYSLRPNLDNSHFILLRIVIGSTLAQCSFVITCT